MITVEDIRDILKGLTVGQKKKNININAFLFNVSFDKKFISD